MCSCTINYRDGAYQHNETTRMICNNCYHTLPDEPEQESQIDNENVDVNGCLGCLVVIIILGAAICQVIYEAYIKTRG